MSSSDDTTRYNKLITRTVNIIARKEGLPVIFLLVFQDEHGGQVSFRLDENAINQLSEQVAEVLPDASEQSQ